MNFSDQDFISATHAVALFGIGFTWCIEFGFGTQFLEQLGISKPILALVWLAGPLSGLVVQPVIGVISDSYTGSTWGKRRPFIVYGTLIMLFSMIMIAYASDFSLLILSIFWPSHVKDVKWQNAGALAFAVFGFYLLDFSINGVSACCRALIVDITRPEHQALANSWASRMAGFGTVVGYFFGFLNLEALVWRNSPFTEVLFGTQLKILCFICNFFIISTIAITCIYAKEAPGTPTSPFVSRYPSSGRRLSDWMKPLLDIVKGFRRLPLNICRICNIQFWAWLGWFPFLFYASAWVAGKSSSQDPEVAARAGSLALLLNASVSFLTTAIIPHFVGNNRSPAYIPRVMQVWGYSLIAFFVLMQYSYVVKGVRGATILLGLVGIPWGVAMWAPVGVISEYIAAREQNGSNRTAGEYVRVLTDDPLSPRRQSFEEDSSIVADLEGDAIGPRAGNQGELSAGLVLGIHNMYIVVPQLISNLLTSFIFWVSQAKDGSSSGDLFGLCLRVGSVFALAGAWLALRDRK